MPTFPLSLPTGSSAGRDSQVASARIVNGYVEQHGDEAKAPFVIYGAPGLRRWSSGSFVNAERGIIRLDDATLVALLGTQVVLFDRNGTPTAAGNVAGTGRVITSRNRKAMPQVTFVTVSGAVYVLEDGATNLVTDADLPAPNSATYVGSRTIYGISDGRIFASAINDSTSINAAAFDTADSKAGELVRVFESSGYLYVFLSNNVEIWQADASLASSPFPFSPVQQNINVGLLARHSVAEIDASLIWVDDEGIVRLGRDTSAQRVSNNFVERRIAELDRVERTELVGSVSTFHGHKIYTLNSARWTLQYDALVQRWYERETYGRNRWRANYSEQFAGKHIFGADDEGALFELTLDSYRDGEQQIVTEIWCPHSHRFPAHMTVDALKVDVIGGVGLVTGDDADINPVLMIDYSDDGCRTFEGEEQVPLGGIGEYRTTVETYRWGIVEEKGRTWRMRASPAVLKGIIQASLTAEGARS